MAFVHTAKIARPFATRAVEKSVFISQSHDIYTNLALEEWMRTNMDFRQHHVMLYYKNDPCVVVGKAQNPWMDTNIASQPHETDDHKVIALARRQTEAGTQYHDQGCMNLTFFGRPDNDEGGYNMGLIARAMFRKFGLAMQQHEQDLSFYNMKVTGNGTLMGATVEKDNAYQNCTLLVDVNKRNLTNAMSKENALKQEKNYLNISEIDPHITTSGLLSAIGWEYMRTRPHQLKDGGEQLARRQRGFQMINPTDAWFPGLQAIRDRLVAWDWCYGATPKFSIFRTFQVPAALLNNAAKDSNELRVKLDVDGGKIADISLVVPPGLLTSGFTGEAQIVTGLKGQKFSEETLRKIENHLGLEKCRNEKEKFVRECVRKAMVV